MLMLILFESRVSHLDRIPSAPGTITELAGIVSSSAPVHPSSETIVCGPAPPPVEHSMFGGVFATAVAVRGALF